MLFRGSISSTLVVILCCQGITSAQLEFEDVSSSRGILENEIESGFGSGVAAFDYDQDGDIDLYLPQQADSPDRLYRNDGTGNFQDIAGKIGIDVNPEGRSALWFDYDNDRLPDLLIASDCIDSEKTNCEESTLRLYRQLSPGQFEDVTSVSGLDNTGQESSGGHRSTLCCGDIDNDGDLDLLTGMWERDLRLFINNNGVFEDQTLQRGIVNPNAPNMHNPWQSVMHDFNGDGWLDIFTAVDFFPNQLWLNQGNGTFLDVAESSGTDFAFNEMGVTIGDFDNDGDFDIYVTNIFEFEKHNLLLRNESTVENISFVEVAESAGVADTGFGWGTCFLDADNDTFLDLAATNGWFNGIGFDDESKFFLNDGNTLAYRPRGGITFSDVSSDVGFNDSFFGSCLIAADLSRDGDLDLLQVCNPRFMAGPFRILENNLQENKTPDSNWLVVRPRQLDKNHWCIGAVVIAETGDKKLSRAICAGTSIHGQEPAEAFFGLADATIVDRITVRWPYGDESVWENVAAGQILDAVDGDLNRNGSIDMIDMLLLREMRGPCDEDCQADLNHDGVVNRLDAVILGSEIVRDP